MPRTLTESKLLKDQSVNTPLNALKRWNSEIILKFWNNVEILKYIFLEFSEELVKCLKTKKSERIKMLNGKVSN